MYHWDEFTPGLYGIVDEVASEVIKKRWEDLVMGVLEREREAVFYKLTVLAILVARLEAKNKAEGYDVFVTLLRNNGWCFEPVDQEIPKAAFFAYWNVTKQMGYSRNDLMKISLEISLAAEQGNGQAKARELYDDFKQKWYAQNANYIEQSEKNLRRWLKVN